MQQKPRIERLEEFCEWAYKLSRDALMLPPTRPKEAKEARDRALCAINKKLQDFVK